VSLPRRALVLIGSAALAMAGLACRQADEARTPAGAVRAFARAADPRSALRDRERVCSLIGPRTRARLEESARRATQQAGARRALQWTDMLVIGMARPRYDLNGVRVLESSDQRALVETRGPGGSRETVEVVREGELWKIELPVPPPEHAASAPASTSQPQSAPAPRSPALPIPP
jgi:hypothetical protein